jgi:hypothetical protein
MATYREIQDFVRKHHRFVPKSCWIAHVKSEHGLTKRVAPNRQSAGHRLHPCPDEKRKIIEDAMRVLGMLK